MEGKVFPKKTKIVATYGPAIAAPGMVRRAMEAGVDVFRYNFSHGTPEGFAALVSEVRAAEKECGKLAGVLADLQGPKIRVGSMVQDPPATLVAGETFTLLKDEVEGDAQRASVSYSFDPDEFRPGMRILLDDGRLILTVASATPDALRCTVEKGGVLRSHKGVNFPGISTRLPALTEKDCENARAAARLGADFVALSFVRSARDMEQLREVVEAEGANPFLIAKIEKPQAVANLEEILGVTDGVMVARGDLGIEAEIEKVGILQKSIIRRCLESGTPVITATQMLESMVSEPMPTRAEATDVTNAVMDGTDAVMLSEESAMGKYPLEAISILARITAAAEEYLEAHPEDAPGRALSQDARLRRSGPFPIAHAAVSAAQDLEARAIVVHTRSSRTARIVSRFRPRSPILGLSCDNGALRKMALFYGVSPDYIELCQSTDALMAKTRDWLSATFPGEPDSKFVIVTGRVQQQGAAHSIRVYSAGEDLF